MLSRVPSPRGRPTRASTRAGRSRRRARSPSAGFGKATVALRLRTGRTRRASHPGVCGRGSPPPRGSAPSPPTTSVDAAGASGAHRGAITSTTIAATTTTSRRTKREIANVRPRVATTSDRDHLPAHESSGQLQQVGAAEGGDEPRLRENARDAGQPRVVVEERDRDRHADPRANRHARAARPSRRAAAAKARFSTRWKSMRPSAKSAAWRRNRGSTRRAGPTRASIRMPARLHRTPSGEAGF